MFVSRTSVSAYWITQKGLKAVFDYEDNLEKSSHDINCVRDIMKKHFNVSAEHFLDKQFNKNGVNRWGWEGGGLEQCLPRKIM